jgi:hypothetical protein
VALQPASSRAVAAAPPSRMIREREVTVSLR